MNRPRIFISYSSKDRTIVEQVHKILISLDNLDIWRDETRLEADWSQEIAYALADSDVLCLMWSESANDSKWVEYEWLTARALEKRIIPILFPDAPILPEPLHNLHGVHLVVSEPKAACIEVVDRLRGCESFTKSYDYTILPTNSYIPFNHNPDFTGRHADLLELYLKMIGNLNKIGINQVGTVGMGGIGKTQLAVEFAYRFSFAFDSIYWIQAAEVEKWRSEFVKLARRHLGLSISDPDDPEADILYINELHKYCKRNPQTLIIMDNVLEPTLLNDESYFDGFTPLTIGCNLLFTTRQHFSLKGVTSQAVDVLSPENSYKLLTHDRKPNALEEEDHAHAICNAVGYLPLAIILAEGYLYKYLDVSFADYHNELKKNKLNVIDIGELDEKELATRHVTAVGFTLEQDWKKIIDENARLLFQLAGQFGDSEIIPKARLGLLGGIKLGNSILDRPTDKAFNLLHSLSLAEKMGSNSQAVRLHPLVRNFAQNKVPEVKQKMFRINAAKNLRAAYFDYPRLQRELEVRGVAEVLDDLKIAIEWWGKDLQPLEELRLIQSTLRLSANQLTRDPRQLVSHLIGRLKDISTPGITKLLDDATKKQKGVWFNPIYCSLTQPGGHLLRTFEGHSWGVNAVAISPDGKYALSASNDFTLKLWELSSGLVIKTFKGHDKGVTAVAISADGKLAVSASIDRTIKLWKLNTGQTLKTFKGHFGIVTAVAINPDGRTAVSGSGDFTLRMWELSTGKTLKTLKGHSRGVTAVAISPNGSTALSCSYDRTLRLWELSTGDSFNTFKGHSHAVNAVAISPDDKKALSGSQDTTLKLWDLITGQVLKTFEGHHSTVSSVAINKNGETAISGSYDKTLKLWDIKTGQVIKTLQGHSSIVSGVAFCPDDKTVVSSSHDKTIKLWELSSKPSIKAFEKHNDRISGMAINPDGKTAVSGSDDNTIKLWDLSTGKALHTFEGHRWSINAVAINPDGKTAVSGSDDSTLKLWDLSTGKVLHTLEGHSGSVNAVAINLDGKSVVSGSNDKTLKMWDLNTGQVLKTFQEHSDFVNAIVLSPDGKFALSASADRTLKLWDLNSGQSLKTLEGHNDWVSAVEITPDGKAALSGSYDKTIKLWDLSTGQVFKTLEGHSELITVVSFSPNGNYILSGSYDKTIKLWDHGAGQVVTSFICDTPVYSLAISPCGRVVLAGEGNGNVHFLRLEGIE